MEGLSKRESAEEVGQTVDEGRSPNQSPGPPTLVRHEGEVPRERSTCGWRHLLVSRQDHDVAAWAHAVDIDGTREHYHRRATELYYVLEGQGTIVLDGVEQPIRKGSVVHIPPGVVHGAKGRMRVLVVGIPDISDDDLFFPEPSLAASGGNQLSKDGPSPGSALSVDES